MQQISATEKWQKIIQYAQNNRIIFVHNFNRKIIKTY